MDAAEIDAAHRMKRRRENLIKSFAKMSSNPSKVRAYTSTMIRNTIASLIIVLAVSAVAHAQDQSRFGVVVAYPGSIGAEWHVSSRIAIRPDFVFSINSSDSSNTVSSPVVALVSSSDARAIGVGVSALFYVKQWDALRMYVSPRFGYIRTTNNSTTTISLPGGSSQELRNRNSTYVTSGSLGGQYMLGRRFSVFGEAGVAYSDLSTSLEGGFTPQIETSGWSVASRAGVGVVIYF